MNKKAFSLIELLISVAVLGVIITLIVGVFFANVRGQRRVNSQSYIKDSGDYALLILKKKIRNAKELETCNSSEVRILNTEGEETVFTCSGNILYYDGDTLIPSDLQLDSDDCFTCYTSESPPVVEVSFTLENNKTGILEGAEQEFGATMSLRTY